MNGEDQNLSSMSMSDLFRQEVAAQTALLTDALLALEHRPADKKQLEALMRAAHSIKGAARIMGLDLAVKVAHELEDSFVAAQQDKIAITASQTDHLLAGVDFLLKISKCSDEEISGGTPALQPETEKILEKLASVKSARPPSAKPEAPASPAPEAPAAEKQITDSGSNTEAAEQQERKPEAHAQTVRVTAEHLNRILGLVDESTVQMRWLEPFISRMTALKKKQGAIDRRLDGLRLMLEEKPDPELLRAEVSDVCREARDCTAARPTGEKAVTSPLCLSLAFKS